MNRVRSSLRAPTPAAGPPDRLAALCVCCAVVTTLGAAALAALLLGGAGRGAAPEALILLVVSSIPVLSLGRVVRRLDRQTRSDISSGALSANAFEGVVLAALEQPMPVADNGALALALIRIRAHSDAGRAFGRVVARSLMREAAQRLRDTFPDNVGRVTNDAFGVLIRAQDVAALHAVMEQLLDRLEAPARLQGVSPDGAAPATAGELLLEPMAGLAVCAPGESVDRLFARAHVALNHSSRVGLRLTAWDEEMIEPDRTALSLQAQLRAAIAAGELRLDYQPLVASRDGRLVGVEALVRWQHPDRGLLGPAHFVPLAERSALITALTGWVLDEAVSQCARWQVGGHRVPVSVNLSAKLLSDPDLPARVTALLGRHGVPAQLLTIEVTESALIARPAMARQLLGQLRDHGVRLSLDDFGTGYTALSMLNQLPFDELKIDGSFVSAAHRSPADAAIVRSVLELGHRLGMEVVAEGIEDESSLRLAIGMGCDVLQGYYLGRPAPADRIESLLAQPAEERLDRSAGPLADVVPAGEGPPVSPARTVGSHATGSPSTGSHSTGSHSTRPHTSGPHTSGLHAAGRAELRRPRASRQGADVFEQLNLALQTLGRLQGPEESALACRTLISVAHQILDADGAVLLLASSPASCVYQAVQVTGPRELTDDIRTLTFDSRRRSAFSRCLSDGLPLFTADAANSDLVDPLLAERLGGGSALCLPIAGPAGPLGVLAVVWRRPRAELDAALHDAAQLLSAVAGSTLGRLDAFRMARELAETDHVTGLLQRRAFLLRVTALGPGCTIVLLDLDQLTAINAAHGYGHGDQFLKTFAAHLRDGLRLGDVVARWSGEKFALALEDCDPAEAHSFLVDISRNWALLPGAQEFCYGVAGVRPDEAPTLAVDRAHQAMAAAKRDNHRLGPRTLPPQFARATRTISVEDGR